MRLKERGDYSIHHTLLVLISGYVFEDFGFNPGHGNTGASRLSGAFFCANRCDRQIA